MEKVCQHKRGMIRTVFVAAVACLCLCSVNLSAQVNAPNDTTKDGERTGTWVFYFNDEGYVLHDTAGATSYRVMQFKKGVPHGTAREYDMEGHLLWEGTFTHVFPDTVVGPATSYYPNGKIMEKSVFVRGMRNGMDYYYYENGSLEWKCNYTDNYPDGTYTGYYENGQLWRTGPVIMGRKEGIYSFYDAQGILRATKTYVRDTLNGIWTSYYAGGNKKYVTPYVAGNAEGVSVKYDSLGTTETYSIFHDDTLISFMDLITLISDKVVIQDAETGLPLAKILYDYAQKKYPEVPTILAFCIEQIMDFYFITGDAENTPVWIRKYYDACLAMNGTADAVNAQNWHLLSMEAQSMGMDSISDAADAQCIVASYLHGKPTRETVEFMARRAALLFSQDLKEQGRAEYDSLVALCNTADDSLHSACFDAEMEYGNYLVLNNAFDRSEQLYASLQEHADPEEKNKLRFAVADMYFNENRNDEGAAICRTLSAAFGTTQKDTSLQMETLDRLAQYDAVAGNYAAAEKKYLDLLRLSRLTAAEDSDTYFGYTDRLADFYDNVGRYEKSLPMRTASLGYYARKVADTSSFDAFLNADINQTTYITHILDAGNTLSNYGFIDEGGSMFETAVTAAQDYFGDSSFEYMRSLADYAGYQMDKNEYAASEASYKKVIALTEKYFPGDPNYYTWFDDLAELYTRSGDYSQALQCATTAYEHRKQEYPEDHPLMLASYTRLAAIYDKTGDIADAAQLYTKSLDLQLGKINENFAVMNEDEKSDFLQTFRYQFDVYNDFAIRNADSMPALAGKLFDYQLANRSMLLFSSVAARNRFAESGDPRLKKQYEDWLGMRQWINKLEASPDNNLNIDSLRDIADAEEKTLNLAAGEKIQYVKLAHWEEVRKALKPGEAAVEIMAVTTYNDSVISGTEYAALILRSDAEQPQVVYLCRDDSLNKYIARRAGEKDIAYVNRLYGYAEIPEDDDIYSGQHLDALLVEPLRKYLSGVHTLYLSNSGLMTKLNFAAIPVSSSQSVADLFHIVMLSSTQELAEGLQPVLLEAGDTLALFGGIDYQASDAALEKAAGGLPSQKIAGPAVDLPLPADTATRGGSWKYLPGTKTEIMGIDQTLNTKKLPVEIFSGPDASEDIFKSFSGHAPAVLHLATHGYFLSDSAMNYSSAGMYQSGLLLAGAARSWKGEKMPSGLQDGLLTAEELSYTDLSACKLVVLSACETGLGTINNDEGVFGLQRAIRLAGVPAVIMSLWQVSDRETAFFMQNFYANWAGGLSLEEAFTRAQDLMRKKYGPYYWAAFVLVR